MNINNSNIINYLSENINLVISLYESLKSEKETLIQENQRLKNELKLKIEAFQELEDKYSNLKVAKALSDGSNSKEVKTKIHSLVREIDNCIALLNQ